MLWLVWFYVAMETVEVTCKYYVIQKEDGSSTSTGEQPTTQSAEKGSTPKPPDDPVDQQKPKEQTGHLPHDSDKTTTAMPPSSPPESVFKDLKPSNTRYTFVKKDEL